MEIAINEMTRVTLLAVTGRVDSSNAYELSDALNNQIGRNAINLVVDLEGVDYMSSAGLRALVEALKQAKSDGGDLRLCSPSERVREVLTLAGLDSIFEIYDDQVSAVGSF